MPVRQVSLCNSISEDIPVTGEDDLFDFQVVTSRKKGKKRYASGESQESNLTEDVSISYGGARPKTTAHSRGEIPRLKGKKVKSQKEKLNKRSQNLTKMVIFFVKIRNAN